MTITFLFCSPAAGTIDTTDERLYVALWIFLIGLFILAAHVGLFVYRSRKAMRRSGWVLKVVLILSLFVVPLAFFWIVLSGNACGFGANYGPICLIIFEGRGIVAQLASWRCPQRPPEQSPIPLD